MRSAPLDGVLSGRKGATLKLFPFRRCVQLDVPEEWLALGTFDSGGVIYE
jgi:hypothetical protein